MNFDVRRECRQLQSKGAAGERREGRTSRRRTGMAPAARLPKQQSTGLAARRQNLSHTNLLHQPLSNSLARHLFLLVITVRKNRRLHPASIQVLFTPSW